MSPKKWGARLATFLLLLMTFLAVSLVGLSVYLGRDIPSQLVKSLEKIILALLALITYIVRCIIVRRGGRLQSFLKDLRKARKPPKKGPKRGRRDPESVAKKSRISS